MALQSKPIGIMRDLQQKLQFRFPSYTFANSYDSNGNPVLIMSQSATPTVGQDNVLITILPIPVDYAPTDALGLAQRVFSPNLCQILEQKNATTGITTAQTTLNAILWEESKEGLAVQIWAQADNTDAPVAQSQIASGVLVQSLGDLLNPRIGEV